MISARLWKLYIFPFLVVLAIMAYEQIKTSYLQTVPFEQIAKNTNALSELDQRLFEEAEVEKVIDGDTIQLTTGQRVRYIGIDTPETKHPKKSVQCYGREAASRNRELVEGKKILMEKDVSNTDRYDRLLRYIYLQNPEATQEALFINEYLVEQGYAQALTYPPAVKYNQQMIDAQRVAQKEKKGLWGKCN